MLSLDDPRWKQLQGGYRAPYDASVPISRFERGEDVWKDLWEELHHQGDVGEASYAAVPHLVRISAARSSRDWNLYALASVIEVERHRKRNPPLPPWLADAYAAAWQTLLSLALLDLATVQDPDALRCMLGAVALARGRLELGAWISNADESTIDEDLEQRCAWSQLYR